jgi:hypothetical protein
MRNKFSLKTGSLLVFWHASHRNSAYPSHILSVVEAIYKLCYVEKGGRQYYAKYSVRASHRGGGVSKISKIALHFWSLSWHLKKPRFILYEGLEMRLQFLFIYSFSEVDVFIFSPNHQLLLSGINSEYYIHMLDKKLVYKNILH